MIRVVRHLLLLVALGAILAPAAAQANPNRDCNADGDLDKTYSNVELRNALDDLPSDLDEYSNCREVISGAIAAGSDRGDNRPGSGDGGGTGGGGGGGSLSPEDEQQALAQDNADLEAITGEDGSKPNVKVGDEEVEPGSNGLFDLASASNDVPMPLLVALIAVGLLAIIGGLVALRERVPGLARIPLLSKIPRVSLPRFRR